MPSSSSAKLACLLVLFAASLHVLGQQQAEAQHNDGTVLAAESTGDAVCNIHFALMPDAFNVMPLPASLQRPHSTTSFCPTTFHSFLDTWTDALRLRLPDGRLL